MNCYTRVCRHYFKGVEYIKLYIAFVVRRIPFEESLLLEELSNLFLNHRTLADSSTVISWASPFVILGVLASFCCFYFIFIENHLSKQCRP